MVVLALPRGGVPLAVEVANAIGAEMDLMLVRKLGLPGQEELAMGAIASGGVRILNDDVVSMSATDEATIESVVETESSELQRRERQYRGDKPWPDLRGKVVILVDDGLATGASMRAAAKAVQHHFPEKVVIAVPVAPEETAGAMRQEVDEFVCLATPQPFYGVGQWYREFAQLSDEDVARLMAQHQRTENNNESESMTD